MCTMPRGIICNCALLEITNNVPVLAHYLQPSSALFRKNMPLSPDLMRGSNELLDLPDRGKHQHSIPSLRFEDMRTFGSLVVQAHTKSRVFELSLQSEHV
jgi:hypothetical protein